MRAFRVFPLLLVLCCKSATEPAIQVSVAVRLDTVVASLASGRAHVEVPLSLRNDGTGEVYILPCEQRLQRDDGGRWSTVTSAKCLLVTGQEAKIGPGEQYLFTLVAESGDGRAWSPVTIPGLYRVALVVRRWPSSSVIVSSPFIVQY